MNIKDLVRAAKMVPEPGYYAGRGATISDLNSEMLNTFADLIKKEHGDKAHDNFVKMVWGMKSLSATAFLENLFSLEKAGWQINEANLEERHYSFSSEGEALGLVAEMLSVFAGHEKSDDTDSIRRGFRMV